MKYNYQRKMSSIEARASYILDTCKERIIEDSLQYITLNKDFSAIAFSKSELDFLYEEIFQSNTYLSNTFIKDDDVIFDVGANIGISSIFFAKQANNLKIYSFEPIDRLHSVMKMNLFIHSHSALFKSFNCGLGQENQNNVPFSFFRYNTLISTQYPNLEEDSQLISTYLENTNESTNSQQLVNFIIESQQEVFCQIRTISFIIEKEKINRIDLLKIDVEKAELNVLKGIKNEDWKKINQIIVEVHDKDNKLSIVKSLLTEHGYTVKVQQEKNLRGTGLYVLHAGRKTFNSISKMNKMVI